jgi:hypothetical protein
MLVRAYEINPLRKSKVRHIELGENKKETCSVKLLKVALIRPSSHEERGVQNHR